MPLKRIGMAGQDVYENEMKIVDSVDYLRGLKGPDSVLIALNNILSGVIKDKGSFNYDSEAVINNMTTPGVYNHGASIIGTNGGYGLLLVLKTNKYIVQLDFVSSGKIIFRFSPYEGTSWTTWKYLTFT